MEVDIVQKQMEESRMPKSIVAEGIPLGCWLCDPDA